MKPFIAIVKSTGGVLEKYQDFDTRAEADAFLLAGGPGHGPDGFVAPNPGGDNWHYWVIDKMAKTVGYDQVRQDADITMRRWERDFRKATTAMPDLQEDIIDSMNIAQLARLSQRAMNSHANKKAVRARKP